MTIIARIGGVMIPMLCLAWGGTGVHASAAPAIELTAPLTAVEFADGDEFATAVIGKPWDMTQMYDLAWRARYYEPLTPIANGIWTGTYWSPTAFYWPLFRGVISPEPDYMQYFSWHDNGTPYGPLNPVDAGCYTRLSIRHALDSKNRSFIYVKWYQTYLEPDENHVGFMDADAANCAFVPYDSGFRIHDIDLTGQTYYNERVGRACAPLDQTGVWSGTVYGFYVVPSMDGPAGTVYSVDWIRLYNAAASPVLPVTWTTASVPLDDDAYSVQLFVDTDAAGYDGDLLISGLQNDGRYDLLTAALPPGDYFVYLRLVRAEEASFSTLAVSRYSARIRIGAPPSFAFTAPTMTSGVDYATAELGNPWDMHGADDLDLTRMHDIVSYSFSDGMFHATASAAGDSQVWLNLQCRKQWLPIATARYRYFTFRMYYDTSKYNDYTDMDQRSWDMGNVARLQWAKSDFAADGSYTKDILLLEGWHSYTVDLWDNALLETRGIDCNCTAQAGWLPVGQVSYLGIHPLENSVPLDFAIGDVKLCAMNAPENNAYTIAWNAADPDSASLTVTLYYGCYDDAGTFHQMPQPIAAVKNAKAVNSCVWNTIGVSSGEYYIRAVVSDGVHELSRMSPAPVVVQGCGPAIRANGDLFNTTLSSSDNISISVQMEAGPYAGTEVDWWIVACAGSSWYYLNSALQWIPFDGDVAQCRPVYMGPLRDLPETTVLNCAGLPEGAYTFWFAVDYPMDGVLNLAGPILAASVIVVLR